MPRNPDKIDYTGSFPEGFEIFSELSDPRGEGHTRHHFGEIIFMAFTAIVCGVKSYELMEEFCELREKWFRKWLKLPNGLPCYNTFARVMEALDPVPFSACILTYLQQAGAVISGEQIAIDGKALRGSRSLGINHIHAVSAWACESGLTLAQAFVSDKSNEITAIPELLQMLNLKGAVITIDAMGTQREIAAQIVDGKGDYLLCVKDNQKKLYQEISDHFDFASRQLGQAQLDPKNWSYHESEEQAHGRLEKRQTVVCHELAWMDHDIRAMWKGLGSIMMVTRRSETKAGKVRTQTSYYMSSLKEERAEKIQGYIRGHWRIENSCHWVLDTLFREDHNQTVQRNAAKNLGTLRRIVLNALKQAPDHSARNRKRPSSLTRKQLRAMHDEAQLEEILSLV